MVFLVELADRYLIRRRSVLHEILRGFREAGSAFEDVGGPDRLDPQLGTDLDSGETLCPV